MSSDESEYQGDGTKRFVVLDRGWRSKECGLWLRSIDRESNKLRKGPFERYLPGNIPRQRVDSQRVSTRNPIPFLPKNFYSREWLDSLDDEERELLYIQPGHDLS
jgi:hypothetical protein